MLTRREFVALAPLGAAWVSAAAHAQPGDPAERGSAVKRFFHPAVAPLTRGPGYHYFGYYDKHQWDPTGRWLLGLEVGFFDRTQAPDDIAIIGVVDLLGDRRFVPLCQTHAWNWQQGAMLHWLGDTGDFIHNDRREGAFTSVVRDPEGHERRVLPRPVYNVSRDGRQAASLNFARVHRTRPGYGYCGTRDAGESVPAPENDGIWHMDVETGETRLIITLAQIAALEPDDRMTGAEHWFNHLLFSRDGSRFIFLHRWSQPGKGWFTRLYTANPDGSEIRLLADEGMTSHFDWLESSHVLAWSRHEGKDAYHLYEDGTGRVETMGEDLFETDGHCSFSPDSEWVLTDTYPDKRRLRTLMLYHRATNTRVDIGRFYALPNLDGELRCDLHPRWSRDGRAVCIDSVHEGERQMYALDVSEIVGAFSR